MAKLIRNDVELRRFRRVPIVGCTATDLPGLQEKCTSFGINIFMLKPLMEKAIRDLIDRLMDPVEVGKRRNA
jgi:CheY-like chemotaxis protein